MNTSERYYMLEKAYYILKNMVAQDNSFQYTKKIIRKIVEEMHSERYVIADPARNCKSRLQSCDCQL